MFLLLKVGAYISAVPRALQMKFSGIAEAMLEKLKLEKYNGFYFDRKEETKCRLCTPEGWFPCQVSRKKTEASGRSKGIKRFYFPFRVALTGSPFPKLNLESGIAGSVGEREGLSGWCPQARGWLYREANYPTYSDGAKIKPTVFGLTTIHSNSLKSLFSVPLTRSLNKLL